MMLERLADIFNNLDKLEYQYEKVGSQVWIVENFLPEDIFQTCLKETDNPKIWERDQLIKHPLPEVLRYENNKFYEMPVTEAIVNHLNSGKFMSWGEGLSNIEGLLPDPYLHGAGIVKMPRGKTITLHTDFTWNAKIKTQHSMNVGLYMNKEWREEWGGNLQFWNDDSTVCHLDIVVKPNSLIFWDKPTKVIHGFADGLNCPEDITRDVLMVFYYESHDVPRDRVSKSTLNRKDISHDDM